MKMNVARDEARGVHVNSDQRIARIAGVLFLITFITSIPALYLLQPVLDDPGGYVTARLVESTFIAIGLFSVLAVVSWQDASGVDPGLAETLALIKDWTFLLGPGFIVGLGNGLILGYLMYRSGLVPRQMAMLGLIGGPLIIASGIAVLFDVFQFGGTGQSLATIPEFLWELSLGIYLTVKGFRPSPILSEDARPVMQAL